jgi:D-methionine transport system ATP-binding protein
MIDFENVSVVYGRGGRAVQAVKDVSLSIGKGEVFGIVGASGAGKSSLLRTVNLLERPSSGRVLVDGAAINSLAGEPLRRLRQGVGMIFQHFNLIRSKTVFENIALAMKIAGAPAASIEPRVLELLSLVGLSEKRGAFPNQLSGGQKQRVGIARALANNPKTLLCDEPTSALDLESTRAILELIKEVNEKFGLTVVLITHEMEVVKNICGKVAVMSDGRLVEAGDAYGIFAHPKHDVTKELVKSALNLELPEHVRRGAKGAVLKISFRGETAVEPVISDTVKSFGVGIGILHGRIEYIGGRPLGVLLVSLDGEAGPVALAIERLKEKTAKVEEIDVA